MYLTVVGPLTPPESAKRYLGQARTTLVKMINDWVKSGNGRGMLIEEPAERLSKEEVYCFADGDDHRSNFLQGSATHHLLFWHLAHEHQLLSSVREQLDHSFLCDNGKAPETSTPSMSNSKARKTTKEKREARMDSLMSTIVGIAGVLDTDRKVNEMNSDIHEAERVREALHAKIRLVDSAGRECMDKTFEARRLNDSAMLEYYQNNTRNLV